MEEQYKYFAFISCISDDKKWGIKILRNLESYCLPEDICNVYGIQRKPMSPIFFVPKESNVELKDSLDASRNLIVICSTNSAKSAWLNCEVERFASTGKEQNIFPFIIDCVVNSEGIDNECLPVLIKQYLNSDYPNVITDGWSHAIDKLVASMLNIDINALHKRTLCSKIFNFFNRKNTENQSRSILENSKNMSTNSIAEPMGLENKTQTSHNSRHSRPYKFNNSSITIVYGDLLASKADVLVSSDDSNISMGGGVSGAILCQGGEIILNEASKLAPASLGDVVVTCAGNLPHAKYIYHCITIDEKRMLQIFSGQITEEEILNNLLEHAVNKCFALLQTLEISSIAFPVLGTGSAKIPVKKSIEIMSAAIADNLCKTNKGVSVELYVHDIYDLMSESDYIRVFESFAAKEAVAEYKEKQEIGEEEHFDLCIAPKPILTDHMVFISYSRKDKNIAEYLCKTLKDNNINYWIDKEGIYCSSNYKDVIVDAIDSAKAVIFLSSVNSNASINVVREIGYAVNRNKPILPLMIDDSEFAKSIRLDISDIDQIDYRNPKTAAKKLIASLMLAFYK